MLVYSIWDLWIFTFLESIFNALPIIAIIFLAFSGVLGLALLLNHLDNKYWHTKTWPWYKQLGLILLIIPAMLIIGLIIILSMV